MCPGLVQMVHFSSACSIVLNDHVDVDAVDIAVRPSARPSMCYIEIRSYDERRRYFVSLQSVMIFVIIIIIISFGTAFRTNKAVLTSPALHSTVSNKACVIYGRTISNMLNACFVYFSQIGVGA